MDTCVLLLLMYELYRSLFGKNEPTCGKRKRKTNDSIIGCCQMNNNKSNTVPFCDQSSMGRDVRVVDRGANNDGILTIDTIAVARKMLLLTMEW